MAVNDRSYIRILPESTGDRVGFCTVLDVEYNNKTGSFPVGATVVGGTSGTTGVVKRDLVDNDLSTSGVVTIELAEGYESKNYNATEALNIESVSQATCTTAGYGIYYNANVNVGKNNPTYGQFVDNEGAAYTRFAEGSPIFDAFGRLSTSQLTVQDEHQHQYGEHSDHFTETLVSAATITHEVASASVVFSCPTTSGASAKRVSDKYYKYQAGKSQLAMMTLAIGDTGKANVNRMWGYGDDDNGLFFLLEGTTLNVMLRSKVSGSVVDTKIAQSSWNNDKLDGSGNSVNLSGHTLDVSKDNIYWIDMQWLGAGRVRFGVIIDGVRITCHEILNANNNTLPYMQTATLPLYAEQTNTGVAASTSEMRVFVQAIMTEGDFQPPHAHFAAALTGITVTGANTNLVTFRSKQQFNSVDNRIQAYGDELYVFTDTEPVLIEVVRDATLGGTPTWTVDPGAASSVEADTAGTTVTGGTVVASYLVGTGTPENINLREIFAYNTDTMHRKADITEFISYSIRCSLLSGTTTDVSLTANWHENQ
jgi:hypothetical protein